MYFRYKLTVFRDLFDRFTLVCFFWDKIAEGPDSFCHHCNNRISFLTNGLKKSIKQKHRLLNIFNKNPTDENKTNYTHHRILLTSLLRLNERSHHENQLEINKDDSTKCWKIIKEVIGNSAGLKDQSSSVVIITQDLYSQFYIYIFIYSLVTCSTL